MKNYPSQTALLIAILLAPSICFAQSLPNLSGFHQPIAKCQKPAPKTIITQTGIFPDDPPGPFSFEVVATAQVGTDGIAPTDHATITMYDDKCKLRYEQVFPYAGEITFETLLWNNQFLLHVVTVSAVGKPADDIIYNHEFLNVALFPVQPPDLNSDKFSTIFVGNIGQGKGSGIVETFQITLGQKPPLVTPFSVMFRLQNIPLPEGQSLAAFTGPTVIVPPPHTNPSTAWPDTSYNTGFPLLHYLFPGSSGY